MKYRYLYQTKDNENREGWIEARSRENAYAKLRQAGIRPYRVIGDDPVNWRPWAVGAVIAVLAGALAAVLLFGDDGRGPCPRGQLEGDRELIAAGVYCGWTNVFDTALDRCLAAYAQPGRFVRRPVLSAEEIAAFPSALEGSVVYRRGEPAEHRQLKDIVARMREDMRAYLAAGGDVKGYLDFLDERQTQELEFREKAVDAVYRAPESVRYRAWLGVNARLKDMGIEQLSRPADLSDGEQL